MTIIALVLALIYVGSLLVKVRMELERTSEALTSAILELKEQERWKSPISRRASKTLMHIGKVLSDYRKYYGL